VPSLMAWCRHKNMSSVCMRTDAIAQEV